MSSTKFYILATWPVYNINSIHVVQVNGHRHIWVFLKELRKNIHKIQTTSLCSTRMFCGRVDPAHWKLPLFCWVWLRAAAPGADGSGKSAGKMNDSSLSSKKTLLSPQWSMWEWGKKRNGDRERKEDILRGHQVGNYDWKIVKLFSRREPKSILKAMYIMGILKLLCLGCRPISYYVPTPTTPAEAHFYIYSKMYYTIQCLLWNWIFKGSEDRVSFDTFQNRQHTQMLV